MCQKYNNLLEQFLQVSMSMRSAAHTSESRMQYEEKRLLLMIKLHNGIQTKELAYLQGSQPDDTKHMLQKLERDGLLSTQTSEEGGSVSITEKGRELLAENIADRKNTTFFSALTEDEQETLSQLLCKLQKATEQNGEKNAGHFHERYHFFSEDIRPHQFSEHNGFGRRHPHWKMRSMFERESQR